MKKSARLLIGLVLFAILFVYSAVTRDRTAESKLTVTPTPSTISAQVSGDKAITVKKVIDGDTIEISTGQKVRYIGIDTPESTIQKECFGAEASVKNKELVEGKSVRLEKDVSETDKYGRLLRYVYVGDVFINDELVRQGFANASTYPPDVKYQDKFSEAQKEARENNRGFWSKCNVQGASNTGDLDCSDFKTQKKAQDYFISKGGPDKDPDKLDSDHDGKVCINLP